jgi:branched-chain amino acid transport system ATP-binding protein
MSVLLETEDVTVRFGGNVAVDAASVTAEAGKVTGLIGPNGAGKTTLFNVVTGLLPPTDGVVRLDGRDITKLKPHRRARLGMARTFQRLELFTSLSVRENIRVAGEIRNRWSRAFLGLSRDRTLGREVDEMIDRIGLGAVADEEVSSIPTGQARVVELGRALMTRPSLLLLDEPASGQDDAETEAFGVLLRQLAADGIGIFLVEHDVALVMDVCDHIHVVDFGEIIAGGSPDEIQRDQIVLDAYLGDGS